MEKKYYVKVTVLGTYWYSDEAMTIFHRENGPAIEYANGDKAWLQNDKCHRLDGPAVELANGDKFWYENGLRHRLDGPAIEHANGHKEWYQNGKLHRLDGPAVELVNGRKEYYIEDKKLTEREFLVQTQADSCEDKIVTIDGVDYKLTKV